MAFRACARNLRTGYVSGGTGTVRPMSDHGRRASFWTRWPDEHTGPLWAGVHLHRRGGVTAVVGVELFTEPPANARLPGNAPVSTDLGLDLLPLAPDALQGVDIRSLRVEELIRRFGASGEDAGAMVANLGVRGARYSADHWARVAQVVRTHRETKGRGVTAAVAVHWAVSPHTAKKWIARARTEGFLAVSANRTDVAANRTPCDGTSNPCGCGYYDAPPH